MHSGAYKTRDYEPVVHSRRNVLLVSRVEAQAGEQSRRRNEKTATRNGQAGIELKSCHV